MEERITVTGMTGGKAGTVNTAGRVTGGMGNITHNTGSRDVTYRADGANIGQMGHQGRAENIQFGSAAPGTQRQGTESLSSAQLLEKLKTAEVTDETLQKFKDNKVTGDLFMDEDLEELLAELGVTNKMDIRKLKKVQKNLAGN